MRNCAVIGLQFGDEGKGMVVDYLAGTLKPSPDRPLMVVRFCGGHQAGHTVIRNGIRHVFSSFGSGTLCGVPTYWSRYCTVSPLGLFNEYNVLRSKGVTPEIYIDPEAPVTTPFDMYGNRKEHNKLGHGTCGVGFGSTLKREEDHYQLHYIDLFYPEILKTKICMIKNYYFKQWDDKFTTEVLDVLSEDMEKFMSHCKFAVEHFPMASSDILYLKTEIFESSQGLMLDKDIGFFPHVTRSNVGMGALDKFAEFDFSTDVHLVTRAYQTRHGNGPMTNICVPHKITANPDETNVSNRWQGEFRRTLLDINLLNYAINKDTRYNSYFTLCITCLDHVAEDGYRFTVDGQIVKCDNEEHFVKAVASRLCRVFDKVLGFTIRNGQTIATDYTEKCKW